MYETPPVYLRGKAKLCRKFFAKLSFKKAAQRTVPR